MASRYGHTRRHAPRLRPSPLVADAEPGGRVHVYPSWQPHVLDELTCWCEPKQDWVMRTDGTWNYIVVHHEGH